MELLILVAAAPQRETGPVSKSLDVLDRLAFHTFHKIGKVVRVGGAGEREVLPDEKPEAVAGVVEVLGLVEAAAPDAEHVEPGAFRLAQSLVELALVDLAGETAIGDPVRAFGEDLLAVDHKGHPAVRCVQRDGSKADRESFVRDDLEGIDGSHPQVEQVALLDAASVRMPADDLLAFDLHLDGVDARRAADQGRRGCCRRAHRAPFPLGAGRR